MAAVPQKALGTHADADVDTGAVVLAAGTTRRLKQEGERNLHGELSSSVPEGGSIRALVRQHRLWDHQRPVLTNHVPAVGTSE